MPSKVAGRADSSPSLSARLASTEIEFRPDPPLVAAASAVKMLREYPGDPVMQVVAIVDFLCAAAVDRDACFDALVRADGEEVGQVYGWLCGEYRIARLAEEAEANRPRKKADDVARWGEVG